jgi:hypothetical protein
MSTIRCDNFGPSAGGTTYSARGIAKAWVNFDGTGTIAARDSENVSSLTDNGSSDYTVNWSSSLGNANYNFTFGGNVADGVVAAINTGQAAPTASAIRVRSYNVSWAGVDGSYVNLSINGDLA